MQFSEFRTAPNCERFWLKRRVPLDKDTVPSSSPFDGVRPVSFQNLFDVDLSRHRLQSILNVILSVLEYLSKATKTSQLNDYLLTYRELGPKRWLDVQIEQQDRSSSAEIYTNSPGIEYKGDAQSLVFKPLIVKRKRYNLSVIIYNF